MARFALRKTVCIIAAALAGAAVSPSPAFSADDETRTALAAEGKTANTLGKTLSEKARTDTPTYADDKISIKVKDQTVEVDRTALVPQSDGSRIKYLRSAQDFEDQRALYDDPSALLERSALQKNSAQTDSLIEHATIEGAVYQVVSRLAASQREDFDHASFLATTNNILADLENRLKDVAICSSGGILEKTTSTKHVQRLFNCQQVLDQSSNCTVTHSYTINSTTGEVTDGQWTPANCVTAALGLADGFAQGTYTCTDMPSVTGGCMTVGSNTVCEAAFGASPLPGVSPFCKKVAVTAVTNFYKGDTGCWNALKGYDAAGNPVYEEVCGGQNTADRLDTCEAYRNNPACTLVSNTCTKGAEGPSGTCYASDLVYDCGTDVEVDSLKADTSYNCAGIACLGEECINAERTYSTDFAKLTSMLSAVQYMALDMSCSGLDENGNATSNLGEGCRVLAGTASSCTVSVGGEQDCCAAVDGPGPGEYLQMILQANRSRAGTNTVREASSRKLSTVTGSGGSGLSYEPLAMEIAGQYGETKGKAEDIVKAGIGYLSRPFATGVDNIYGSTDYIAEPMSQFKLWVADEMRTYLKDVFVGILEGAGYGGTRSTLTAEAKNAAEEAMDQALTSLDNGTESVLGTIDAVFVAYQTANLVSNAEYKCERAEYETVSRREAGSCHYVGSYCKDDGSGSPCAVKEQVYCCFASPLSRILNEQVKEGQGSLTADNGSWGTPENPKCSGIQMKNIERIDWSKINLDEWLGLMKLSQTKVEPASASSYGLRALAGESEGVLGLDAVKTGLLTRTSDKLDGQDVDGLRIAAQHCMTLDLGNGVVVRNGCEGSLTGALECRYNGTLVDCEELAYRNSLQYLLGNILTSQTYWDEGYRCTEGSVNIDCSSLYSQESYWRALEEYARIIGGTTYLHRYVCLDTSRTFTSAICENAMSQNYCSCLPGNFICQDGNRPVACSSLGSTKNRCECMDGVCESNCTYGGVPKGLEDNADHVCTTATCPYGRSVDGQVNCDSAICPYG